LERADAIDLLPKSNGSTLRKIVRRWGSGCSPISLGTSHWSCQAVLIRRGRMPFQSKISRDWFSAEYERNIRDC